MGTARIAVVTAFVLGALVGAGSLYAWHSRQGLLQSDLEASHHAILLNNNQAYFGRLQQRGADYLILNDVFYVQSRVDEESKKTTHALVKRGNEMHGPTKMILNRNNIQFIEPVSPDSQVGKLIAEAAKTTAK